MIKDLPELWAVWCPTQEVKSMVEKKLKESGYKPIGIGCDPWVPCFIRCLYPKSEKESYTDIHNLDFLPINARNGYKEITLRKILEGEVLKEEEESINDKIESLCEEHETDEDDIVEFYRLLSKIIVEECEKRFVKK